MTRDTTRSRKVRGSQIRQSRDEKRTRTAGAGGSGEAGAAPRGGAGHGAHPGTPAGAGTANSAAAFADEGSFVETEAVRAVKGRVERWLDVGRPVHLVGPTGCGKTALAMAAARDRDRPVVFVNGDADMTTADLVGEFAEEERHSIRDKYVHNVQKSTDIVRDRWVDNPLTTAVREGATLVYNEFSRTKPVANNVLLSVFEEGVLELPGQRGEDRYVEVHPEFRAVLTSNDVEYAGVHEPQDALLDRLIGVHMDFYDRETEREIVRSHLASDDGDGPGVAAETETETEAAALAHVDRVVDDMRALRDRLDVTVGTRAQVMAAEGLAALGAGDITDEARCQVYTDVLASKVSSREDVAALRETVASVVRS